jgi:hypothetical protein
MPDSPSADDIRRQMSRIRCDLHEDVRGIVENARVITDWKHYVRRYPWACMAGAVAVGYLVIPRRLEIMRPDPDTLAELAKTNRLIVNSQPQPQLRGGTVASMFTFLANTFVRAAIGYMGQQAGKILRTQVERHP